MFCAISYISSIIGNFLTVAVKQNVNLEMGVIFYEATMVFGGFFLRLEMDTPAEPNISTYCQGVITLSDQDKMNMDKIWSLQLPQTNNFVDFKMLITLIVCMHSVNILSQLRRTLMIGPSIIMMISLRFDMVKFFTAFTLPIVAFLAVGLFNSDEFTVNGLDTFNIFIQLFAAFTGEQDFGSFQKYAGQTYLTIFILIYFVLLLNLLIAMFSNTYQRIYENKNAIRLKRILDMKNHLSYDPIIGSITSTFFPINIVMLPMMLPVFFAKNKKLNEMVNKL